MGRHLTRDALVRLLVAQHPEQETIEQLLEHVLEACPECRGKLEELVASTHEALALSDVLDRSISHAQAQLHVWERFASLVGGELRDLLAASGEDRRLRITRALHRFKNPLLVDRLLEESHRQIAGNPLEALNLAECAQDVALRLSHDDVGRSIALTCLARSIAYRANALRAAGHLLQAESLLSAAIKLFDEEGTGDPLIEGELMELAAVLARHRRRLVEAEGYLAMAEGLYDTCQDSVRRGQVLVSKALVLAEAGDTERAIKTIREAIALIDREAEPWLYLCAQHGLTEYLIDARQYGEARALLAGNAPLYLAFPEPLIELRRSWVAARIANGLGEAREAEAGFSAIQKGFLTLGLGFEAALVGLDLALLYVEDGRIAEVQKLASEMMPIFMAQDIQREAAAALLLFQEAAGHEAVTATMVCELGAYLRRIHGTASGTPF